MQNIKPIGLIKTILLFFFTSLSIVIGVYYIIPKLLLHGLSFYVSYVIVFYIPFVFMFFLSLFLLYLENKEITMKIILNRFRLQKPTKKELIATAILFVIGTAAFFGLSFTSNILAKISIFSPPDFFPAEINPLKIRDPNLFMLHPMKGNWWMPLIYFIGWFFNIFGEEFLWRGYLLPRMELKWGKKAWIIQGILWGLWHIFWKWNILIMLILAPIITFFVQKYKNTWIGIIFHGAINFIPIIALIIGVIT